MFRLHTAGKKYLVRGTGIDCRVNERQGERNCRHSNVLRFVLRRRDDDTRRHWGEERRSKTETTSRGTQQGSSTSGGYRTDSEDRTAA